MRTPLLMASLTGYVNSIENPKPKGMMGNKKKPTTLMFRDTKRRDPVGRVRKEKENRNKVVKQTILSCSKYF